MADPMKIPSRTIYGVKLPDENYLQYLDLTEDQLFEYVNRGAIICRGKPTLLENLLDHTQSVKPRKHAHYFKPVAGFTEVDIYRVLRMFNVTDQAFGHAIKKLLVAGGRGAGKDVSRDVQEAIDTLIRWQELEAEDKPFVPFKDRPL